MSAGAYGAVMASNYNSRPRLPEILVDGADAHVIRERDTFEDIIRNEKIVELKDALIRMAKLEFTKMQGCGNDYVYVVATKHGLRIRASSRSSCPTGASASVATASSCSRHPLKPTSGWRCTTPTVSRGEMCGNGIRCLARLAYDSGIARKNPIEVETDCGIKTVALTFSDGKIDGATVDMGEPILEGREIPVDADGEIIDYPIEVGGRSRQNHRGLDGQSALRRVSQRRHRSGSSMCTNSRGWDGSSSITSFFRTRQHRIHPAGLTQPS